MKFDRNLVEGLVKEIFGEGFTCLNYRGLWVQILPAGEDDRSKSIAEIFTTSRYLICNPLYRKKVLRFADSYGRIFLGENQRLRVFERHEESNPTI